MKYFFYLFGCAALVVTVIGWRQSVTLNQNGVIADGIITSIAKEKPHTSANIHTPILSYYVYYPVITFKTADGASESFQSPDGSRDTSENLIGTHITVVYDTNNPSLAIVQSSNNLKSSIIVGAVFTILFFAIGFTLQFGRRRSHVINQSTLNV